MCWHGARSSSDLGRERAEARAEPVDMRIAQADRDAVVEQLRSHTADGRLDLDEFGERVEEALAAKTRADLDHSLRQLPRLDLPRAERPQRRLTGLSRRGRVVAVVALTVAAAAVLDAGWLLWMLFWLVPMAAGGGCGGMQHRHRHVELVERPERHTVHV